MKIKTIIKDKLHAIQRKAADHLNRRAGLLSQQQLKICLAVFVVLFAAASVLAVLDSFHTRITKPAEIRTIPRTDPVLKRIHRFRLYMDSIKKFDAVKYDSITRARPRLMDSILTIEKINHY